MAARPVEDDIRLQQQLVGAIAEEGEPARIENDSVEDIAVDDQQPTAIGGMMNGLRRQFDIAEVQAGIVAECLVVIARSEEHTSELQSLMRTSYDVFCLK